MRHLRKTAAALIAVPMMVLPSLAQAQAYRCAVPDAVPVPHADLPTASEPRRVLPVGGYTLAISWAPEFCQRGKSEPTARFECASGNRFGFTLHGLWPDGQGAVWPQYCQPATILPPAIIKGALCATPSAQLLQHEWAKHGTCTSQPPADYFGASTRLFARLRYPDMSALSRQRDLTAGVLARAIAAANPGIDANMMRITANKKGWLDEIWFCLDTVRRFHACPAHQGGVAIDTPIKIWRGPR